MRTLLLPVSALVSAVLISNVCSAQVPEVVVEAPRIGSFGRPDRVIEKDELSARHGSTLDEVLQEDPGLAVIRSGGPGQQSALFIRGASSEHVLILLDGVEVNDPSHVSGGFDLANLDVASIERIEVYKGVRSLRFGSGAMGGVINVITQKGSGPARPFVFAKAGSFATAQLTGGVTGGSEKAHYHLSATRYQTEGISAADGYSEPDGAQFYSLAGRFGYRVTEASDVELISRWLSSKVDLDYASSTGFALVPDDPDYAVGLRHVTTALRWNKKWAGNLSSSTTLSHYYLDRDYTNEPDPANAAYLSNTFLAQAFALDDVREWKVSDEWRVELGSNVRTEKASSDYLSPSFNSQFAEKRDTRYGIFTDFGYDGGDWFADLGARWDHHSEFGSHGTFAVSPGYKWGAALARVKVATAFKAPSLYQLYDPAFGNRDLAPERALGKELEIEQKLGPGSKAAVALFQNDYDNLMQFTTRYENGGESRAQGAELSVETLTGGMLRWQTSYAYVDARNRKTGERLLRRPWNAFKIATEAKWSDLLRTGLEYRSVDSRADRDPLSAAAVSTGAYDLVGASVTWSLADNDRVFARADNLLDRKYQEVAGYGTRGRNFTVGGYFEF